MGRCRCVHVYVLKTEGDVPSVGGFANDREGSTQAQREARRAVRTAVDNGSLLKPSVCQRCGKAETLDAHHDDYANPLKVRWLCRGCHRLENVGETP